MVIKRNGLGNYRIGREKNLYWAVVGFCWAKNWAFIVRYREGRFRPLYFTDSRPINWRINKLRGLRFSSTSI